MENELMHYGVKGMKWGQHIYGDKELDNTSGLNAKGQPYSSKPKSYIVKQGTSYYRMAKNIDEGSSSLYVSKNPSEYLSYGQYLKKYTTTKDTKVAGYKEIGEIYSKSQNVKIKDLEKWYKGGDWEDAIRYDNDKRSKFISEAKKRGFDAIVDPSNSGIDIGTGSNNGRNNAIVFINESSITNDYIYDTNTKTLVWSKSS